MQRGLPLRQAAGSALARGDQEGLQVAAHCFERLLTPLPVHVPFPRPAWLAALTVASWGASVPAVRARWVRSLWAVVLSECVRSQAGGVGACTSVTNSHITAVGLQQ